MSISNTLTFHSMNRRNRIIASILVIALTTAAATAFWQFYLKDHNPHQPPVQQMYQPKPPAMLISAWEKATPTQRASFASIKTHAIDVVLMANHLGPNGASKHCGVHIGLWPVWKVNCWIIIQPGTTRALHTWFVRQGGTALGAIVLTMTTLCAGLSLGVLAAFCGVAATYWGAEILWWTAVASDHAQCLRFRWTAQPDISKIWIPISSSFKIDAYGEWERWIWVGDRRYWGYPTPCKMPADCPILSGGCII